MKDLVLYMTIGYPDENTFFRMLDMLDEEKVPVWNWDSCWEPICGR